MKTNSKFSLKFSLLGLIALIGLFAGVPQQASAITCDSATLTGWFDTGTPPTHARFEYGTSASAVANGAGTPTDVQYFYTENTHQTFSQFIDRLSPSTTYYFRPVATNNYGTRYYDIASFTTPACPQTESTPITNLTADQSSVTSGNGTYLRWNPTNNPTSCNAYGGTNDWAGSKSATGGSFWTGNLNSNTTFALTCSNSAGSDTDSVVVNVTQVTPQPTVSISANSTSVLYGGSSTLTWNSSNATSCNASGGASGWAGAKNTSGTFTASNLTNDTLFTISCSNSAGSDTRSQMVNVGNQPPPTQPSINISANPTNVAYGGSSTINWNASNATSCNASGGTGNWAGPQPLSGSFTTGTLTGNVTFSLVCTSGSLSGSGSATVNVAPQQGNAPQVNLTADQTNLNATNTGTTIRWSPTNNPTSCTASGGTNNWAGTKSTTGGSFVTGALTTTTSFTLTCGNSFGNNTETRTVIVGTQQGSQPTVNTNSASNITQNSATLNGSVNGNGLSTSAWFEWGTTTSLGNSTAQNAYGTGSASYSATISGLSPNTLYYYRAAAQNSQGIVQGNIVSFTTSSAGGGGQEGNQPTVSTNSASNITTSSTTLNGFLNGNGLSTSGWFEWGPSNSMGFTTSSNNYGAGFSNFSAGVSGLNSNSTYYFRAVAENSRGRVYGNVLSFVTNSGGFPVPPPQQQQQAPTAITTPATNIGSGTAQLNSLILNPSNVNAAAWFEYGASTSLGNTTTQTSVGSAASVTHTAPIFNLINGATYYFRAVAENQYGRSFGSILSFVAAGTPAGGGTSTVVIRQPTTTIIQGGVGVESLVRLTIDGGSELITPGERRGYAVTWQNISTQTLRRVVVRVLLPADFNFQTADKGSFTTEDNTLTYNIGTLIPGQTGNLFLVADAGLTLREGELKVVVANLVYTDQSNAQGNALAYATHTVTRTPSQLGASIFSAGFWPTSLLGWLLLLLLLLLAAWLVSRLVAGSRVRTITRIEE